MEKFTITKRQIKGSHGLLNAIKLLILSLLRLVVTLFVEV